MASSSKSKFSNLHKSSNTTSNLQQKQSERRQKLLNEQKQDRDKWMDTGRIDLHRKIPGFQDNLPNETKDTHKSHPFENYIQLSEWFREKPADFENWLLVPCPKGMRCIIVARDGYTELYHKSGRYLRSFHSGLPGDAYNRMSITILDCIYEKLRKTYFVLDVMFYANQDLLSCECIFRFVWIRSKLDENDLNCIEPGKNDAIFSPIDYYDCEDDSKILECLGKYPMWNDNIPTLDGLLFYHKDSSYVRGETPLVGWLFPFLVPDVLGISDYYIHDRYFNQKPIDYTNYLSYMNDFDRKLAIKMKKNSMAQWQNRRHKQERRVNNAIDVDDDEHDEAGKIEEELPVMDEMFAQKELELTGRVNDDFFYEN